MRTHTTSEATAWASPSSPAPAKRRFAPWGDLEEMVVAGMTLVCSEEDWSEF